jgi:hypothetical protein
MLINSNTPAIDCVAERRQILLANKHLRREDGYVIFGGDTYARNRQQG